MKALPLAIMVAGMVPLQAQAAGEEVCNTNIFVTGIDGPKGVDGSNLPFFVGDDLILKASIGADLIRDNALPGAPASEDPFIDFTGIGYGLDCGGGSTEASCYPVGYPEYPPENRGHDIEFIGVTGSDCRTTDEVTSTRWPTPEAENIVSVPALNGPVRLRWHPETGEGDSCNVDMKFRINALHESTNWVVQALGVPYYDDPGTNEDDMVGRCSNGLQATGYGKTVFAVNTCDINVNKQVSLDGVTWSEAVTAVNGQDVYYRVVVTNIGTAPLVGDVVVNDPLLGVNNLPVDAGGLKPGEALAIDGGFIQNFNYKASCSAEETLLNTAGVEAWCRGSDGSEFEVSTTMSDTASMSCSLAPPAIDLVKTAAPATYDAVQQTIAYSFTVTNSGNVALGDVYVSDPLLGPDAVVCPKDQLAVSESMVCNADYSITQADMDATVVDNTATAYGTSPSGSQVSDQDTASVSTTPVYSLFLDKSANPMFFTGQGESIAYSYVLTNQGKQTLYPPYSVMDDKTSVDCPASPASLAPAGSVTCTATYSTTASDVASGSVTNIATGSAMNAPSGGSKVNSNQDQETVVYRAPAIDLVKTADPLVYSSVQQPITYTFTVTNIGDVVLDNVYVADPLLQSQEPPVSVSCPKTELAVSESMICSAGYSITQADMDAKVVNNTATAYGKGPDGTEVSDRSSASISTDPVFELSLVKTASPTFYEAVGDEISYEYELTNTGNQTLYAPYDVVDDKIIDPNKVQCPNTPASLAPLASVTCIATYETTSDDVNNRSVTNKATASAMNAQTGGSKEFSNEDEETVVYRGIKLTYQTLCVNDVPWAEYSFEAWGIEDDDPSKVKYEWVNKVWNAPDETVVSEGFFDNDKGYLLWPGAQADPSLPPSDIPPGDSPLAGWPQPVSWPGWDQNPDGSWTFTPNQFVPELYLRVSINPTDEALAVYPPATPTCAAGPKPELRVEKSVESVEKDGDNFQVEYKVTVFNDGGQPGTYDLVDTLLADESVNPVNLVSPVSYLPGTDIAEPSYPKGVQDGTINDSLQAGDFVSPVTLVTGETLSAGKNEAFTFTLEFDFNDKLFTTNGANCTLEEGEGGKTGFLNLVDVVVGDDVVDSAEACKELLISSITLKKQISLDGNVPWLDADTVGDAPETFFPAAAHYRFVIKNTGNTPLNNVIVNDTELGIIDYPVGSLVADEEVVVDQILDVNDDNRLVVAERCSSHGNLLNTADVAASYFGKTVDDEDPAYLRCMGVPGIQIWKQIGLDGENYEDVEVSATFPEKVYYRIIVMNNGGVPLDNVRVKDDDLPVHLDYTYDGTLAVGESFTLVGVLNVPETDYQSELQVAKPCGETPDSTGRIPNTASVYYGESNEVRDSDSATLICEGDPGIKLTKWVRTGTGDWQDANDQDSALTGLAPLSVEYKIVVVNEGDLNLTNVRVTDGQRNVNKLIGNLDAGAMFTLRGGACEAEDVDCEQLTELTVDPLCTYAEGALTNTASVTGETKEDSPRTVNGGDPAVVVCTGTPDIALVKEVGICEVFVGDFPEGGTACTVENLENSPVNGVVTWYQDDQAPEQLPPADAWYRFTVSNVGSEDLSNVMLDDPTLGIDGYAIGSLPYGSDPVVIDANDIPGLWVDELCGTVDVRNVATVFGDGTAESVQSSDWATLACAQPLVEICPNGNKQKFMTVEYDADDDSSYSAINSPVKVISPIVVEFPTSAVKIEVYDRKGLPVDTYYDVYPGDQLRINLQAINELEFRIYGDNTATAETVETDHLLQKVSFHVSCSNEVNQFDEFGAITVVGN